MLTADERRAVLFLSGVLLVGGVVRWTRSPAVPPPAAAVAPEIKGDDVFRQAALARRAAAQARPLDSTETIDVDTASEAAIERLPGVGPALAQRIVQDRQANGPFGSLDGLDQVSGIGPAMLARLTPHVRFSGPPRPAPQPPAKKAVGHARRAAAHAP